jgi:hypothetical protein
LSDFQLWFSTGLEHITDLKGYDHILFVTLVVLSFPLKDWKKIVWLITGFTLGHSISLALSVLNVVNVPQYFTEIVITLTILATAVFHILNFKNEEPKNSKLLCFLIPLFGGIHGLGFSYLLRSMLGSAGDTALPLFYFNVGLEVGQLLIVTFVLLFSLLLTKVFHCPYKYLKLTLSCIISLVTLVLLIQRF